MNNKAIRIIKAVAWEAAFGLYLGWFIITLGWTRGER